MTVILLDLGPIKPVLTDTPPAWVPTRVLWESLRHWGDIRTRRQAGDEFLSRLRPGDVVIALGDRVREALRLPRVLMHPLVRDGIIFRQLPSLKTKFYDDPSVVTIVEELFACLTGRRPTGTSGSEPASPSP